MRLPRKGAEEKNPESTAETPSVRKPSLRAYLDAKKRQRAKGGAVSGLLPLLFVPLCALVLCVYLYYFTYTRPRVAETRSLVPQQKIEPQRVKLQLVTEPPVCLATCNLEHARGGAALPVGDSAQEVLPASTHEEVLCLQQCVASSQEQRWAFSDSGHLLSFSGKCVHKTGVGAGSVLQLGKCETPLQWRYLPNERHLVLREQHAETRCLTASHLEGPEATLHVEVCASTVAQTWAIRAPPLYT